MKRIVLLFALLLESWAVAQFSLGEQVTYRGNLEFGLDSAFMPQSQQPNLNMTLAATLTLEADLHPVEATLVLDPSVRVGSQGPSFEPGLTEAYGLWSQDDFDLSVGLERLPLETARLSIPLGLERIDGRGIRQGLPGVRLDYYLDDWRVRSALFYRLPSEQIVPLISVERHLGDVELEAHALYAGEPIVGLGGSGLLGDVVLYGEAWLLTEPLGGRGALGLSGYIDVASWTLEAAYLTPKEGNLKDEPDADSEIAALQTVPGEPRPALLTQIALPLGDAGDMSLSATAASFFDKTAVRGRVGASYSFLSREQELTFGVLARVGPEPFTSTMRLEVKSYF